MTAAAQVAAVVLIARFDPRPRNFGMPWVQLKNKQLGDINDRMTEI